MSVYYSDDLTNLKCAVESIIIQTYSNIIFYIYLDGVVSSDVENYLYQLSLENKNIKIISNHQNNGLAFALNQLIEVVVKNKDVEFIARMDSDDISIDTRIEKQVKYIKENDFDLVGTYCTEFGSESSLAVKKVPLTHSDILKYSITRCPFIHPTVMFRKSIFESSNIRYPENTTFTEDMGLWFKILDHKLICGNLPEVLLKYRMSDETVSRRKGINKAISEIKLRSKYMLKLNQFSVKNLILIISRLVFHSLPPKLLKIAYKNFRN
ncbi:hypothetical protein A6E05_10230 [Aliivibrio sp. 1S165]|nr:hypothetical protein A6E05_10230 [Aliivibrio sp. 1S165]OCH36055.1 hypothetical protein A6E06_10960 [Aliivibrio sp. 1S175]